MWEKGGKCTRVRVEQYGRGCKGIEECTREGKCTRGRVEQCGRGVLKGKGRGVH